MSEIQEDSAPTGAPQAVTGSPPDKPEVDPKVSAFVGAWVDRIKAAKDAKKTKAAFTRMDTCMQLAKDGASKEWLTSGKNYVVPVLNRLTNQSVAKLYARNPKALTQRKKRRMFTVWDGTITQLHEAMQAAQVATQTGVPPDPHLVEVMADAERVKAYDTLMDGIADTLTILQNYFIQDPAAQYKQQFKALVRRTKVCAVGYVKLGYQRILEMSPDVRVKLSDATEKLATMRQLMARGERDQLPEDSASEEQLNTLINDLHDEPRLVVQEGPVLSFPKAKAIIIDPACVHLKTLAGADWTAEEYQKTPAEIEEIWKVDISGSFTEYKPDKDTWARWSEKDGALSKTQTARLWRVMNRKTGQEFVVCEGYKDYIKPPSSPDVKLSRFFDIFPLVFNEIEDDDEIYPPSDVWNAHHLQDEYNRSRQGLREHRRANRPAYVSGKGTFSEDDMKKFEAHETAAMIETDVILNADEKIGDKLQAKPVMQIDAKQYEVDSIWQDILRVTGEQEANMGATSDATATESSIAENSRQVSRSDSTDDIDDMLSVLFQAMGQVMLLEMTKETVVKIVGPGAVWPDLPESREEIAESITLDARGGSTGRPNAAADLQKLQTATPLLLQLPGINPIPLGQKILDTLDMGLEDVVVEGLPSITAVNAMAAKPPAPATGGPPGAPGAEPGAQGPEGAHNAPRAPGTAPGPQAAFPAPAHHA